MTKVNDSLNTGYTTSLSQGASIVHNSVQHRSQILKDRAASFLVSDVLMSQTGPFRSTNSSLHAAHLLKQADSDPDSEDVHYSKAVEDGNFT